MAPAAAELRDFCSREFIISETQPSSSWGKVLSNGMERLVHDLRGVRIGVALGGGAARGMSHLGVLKTLEQNGIVVDMIAGASVGAMVGIVYCAGFDCDYSAGRFAADLKLPWPFRMLPSGGYWYLMYKYRRNGFDPMLRKYLFDWKLEQLPLPCLAVTVDLVSGQALVRDRGDAVQAILESINLPVLSPPICRSGQALVDGGLVDNIPADLLAGGGCNFVIAASVTAKIEESVRPQPPGHAHVSHESSLGTANAAAQPASAKPRPQRHRRAIGGDNHRARRHAFRLGGIHAHEGIGRHR